MCYYKNVHMIGGIKINNFGGINEESLDKLVIDFYNYTEFIKKIFDNINEITDKLEINFQSECGLEFRKKVENLKLSFILAQEKLAKYVEELSNVKLKFQDFSSDLSATIIKSSDSLENDFK